MAAHSLHARQGSNTSSTMSSPYPPAPGSPTLTNPDMILPDYDGASSPDRSESPLMMWKNAHAAELQFQSSTHNPYISGPMTPSTPIIYGNGTMLSDIGEVTEVESTPGKSSVPLSLRRVPNGLSDSDALRSSSPTMGYEGGLKKKRSKVHHERRASIESSSTITTEGPAGHFVDFDDVISVDDSNFQGDDEESVVDPNLEDLSVRQAKFLPKPQYAGLQDDKRFSTGSISQRAEEILANAKKRLTTMEGNLTRARSSLHISSPTGTMSIGSGTPSPPMVRSTPSTNSPKSAPGHTRVLSDNSLNNASDSPPRRSASALGAAGGYRQPLTASQSMGDLQGGYARLRVSRHALDASLEPLSEDDGNPEAQPGADGSYGDNLLSPTFGSHIDHGLVRPSSVAQVRDLKDQMHDLKGKISSLREQARADSMKRRSLQSLRTPSPFTHAQVDQWYAGPVKPATTTSVPIAVARNPWNGELDSQDGDAQHHQYPQRQQGQQQQQQQQQEQDEEELEDEEDDPPTPTREVHEVECLQKAEAITIAPAVVELVGADDDVDALYEEEDGELEQFVPAEEGEEYEEVEGEERLEIAGDDSSDLETEDGHQEDDPNADVDDGQSESGDSLYHDAHQTPVSHEDREDAFDYEHFFLHSAMGSFSQNHAPRRGSSSSYDSEGSVETTRGPVAATNIRRNGSVRRRNSGDTISTMDSFATADEGRSSRLTNGDHGGDEEENILPEDNADNRAETPLTASRTGFGAQITDADPVESLHNERPLRQRATSVIYSRPLNHFARNRPSISSFDSAGTQRSFPLVNKPKINGLLTPQGTPHGSPDQVLKTVSERLMNETSTACDKAGGMGDSAALHQLVKDDQILVERLVASLGKCVLGLGESGRASAESRIYRRRIDAARRLLEGMEVSS